ncbi:MAG TPA: hypothetical protein VE913_11615, partial [Longimicrobium sp.]|nr:hypothetical protein [Longimicrobium sp.]
TPDSAGHLRVHAAVNPEMKFELADYDDALLDSLHSGFNAAASKLARMTRPQRKAAARDTFQVEIRQFHAGVVVALSGPESAIKVEGKVSGLPKPITIGKFNLQDGSGEVDDEIAIRAATSAGAASVSRLRPNATLALAESTFGGAFKGAMPAAQLSFAPADGGLVVSIRRGKDETKKLGVLMNKDAVVFVSKAKRGAQELMLHKVNKQEFVHATSGMVQRFIWRALSKREGKLMTAKYEPVENRLSLPPRPKHPDYTGRDKADNVVRHAENAGAASDFLSATTIAEARIDNRRSGQPFREESGSIQIDLFEIDPGDITAGSINGKPGPKFSDGKHNEAAEDVVATREVFLKGGVPAAAIKKWSKGP